MHPVLLPSEGAESLVDACIDGIQDFMYADMTGTGVDGTQGYGVSDPLECVDSLRMRRGG